MNTYWNTYTFESLKMLHRLNVLEKEELNVSKEDLDILISYKDDIKMFKNLDINRYLTIIKNLSIEYIKTPLEIVLILHKNNL